MLGHKKSLDKFKNTEIMSGIFSDHNGMKLEINYKKKSRKFTNMWRLNNMLLNNQWVTEEIKRETKKYWDKWNWNTTYQNLQDAAKAVLRRKFIVINDYIKKWERFQTKRERETIEKIDETRSWFFEKINKIDTPVAKLTKKR